MSSNGPLRVGIGGPVGTGKTALMDALCKTFRSRYEIAAITNDIYTKEDAEFLTRAGSLPPERILGIETGGCPHTAIREDASINLAGVADLRRRFPALDLILIELGGDNLAATFSPELADLTIYVIDVSAGDKIPAKAGLASQGATFSSSTRSTSPRSSARTSTSWIATRGACAASAPSSSPISAPARAWPRFLRSSSAPAASADPVPSAGAAAHRRNRWAPPARAAPWPAIRPT